MPDEVTEETTSEAEVITLTKDQLDALISRERDKTYSRLEKEKKAKDELASKVEELAKAEAERAKAEEKARKDAEAARRKAEEAELSAKELIDRRSRELQEQYETQQNEWAQKYSTLEQQMQQREALFQKEREFQELAAYAERSVNANREKIAPQLIEYITGNTKEEIDASVAKAISTTEAIMSEIAAANAAARAAQPGVSTGGYTPAAPAAPTEGGRDISTMTFAEYQQYRSQLLKTSGDGVGLFG